MLYAFCDYYFTKYSIVDVNVCKINLKNAICKSAGHFFLVKLSIVCNKFSQFSQFYGTQTFYGDFDVYIKMKASYGVDTITV